MSTQSETLYQFKIYLKGISPMIWRRFIIRADTTIAELHFIVQLIMGWSDTHLNCFNIYGKDYGVAHIGGMMFSDHPMKVCLQDLHPRINWKFTYDYDFTEGWEHLIRLEKILPYDSAIQYPICIAGKRACPPEDIGGPDVYDQFLAKLFHLQLKVWARLGAIISTEQKLKNKITESVDVEGYRWSAPRWEYLLFDPEYFNKRRVNESLKQLYQNKGNTLTSLQDSFQQVLWDREFAQ